MLDANLTTGIIQWHMAYGLVHNADMLGLVGDTGSGNLQVGARSAGVPCNVIQPQHHAAHPVAC